MAEECTVVKFSTSQNAAQIESSSDFNKEDNIKTFKEVELGRFYSVTLVISIVTFILDLYFHCWIVYIYYVESKAVYFILTLVFLLVPALITTAFSMRWYLQDDDDSSPTKRPPLWRWGVRLAMLVLQLAPLLRYCDALAYGIKSSVYRRQGNHLKHHKYLRLMHEEEVDASLLRLFSCFLQSAPQAIIQLVFLLTSSRSVQAGQQATPLHNLMGYQSWSVILSVVSIAWGLTAYHHSVRSATMEKEKLTGSGVSMMFLWNLFSTLSRVVALSLLASLYPSWFAGVCLVHWGVMAAWVLLTHRHSTQRCNTCEQLFFATSIGLAYIFAFMPTSDGPSRYSYLAYYLVCFIENTAALLVWCVVGSTTQNPTLHYGAVGLQALSFVLCLLFMVTYYRYCHPSGTSAVISRKVTISPSKC